MTRISVVRKKKKAILLREYFIGWRRGWIVLNRSSLSTLYRTLKNTFIFFLFGIFCRLPLSPSPQIIHEYLASNGLSVAADALAVEAGLVVANHRRQRHLPRMTTPGRRVSSGSGSGSTVPESNTAGDGRALTSLVSPFSIGGYGRRRKVQDEGQIRIGSEGGARADVEADADASGEPIRRSTTWDGVLSPLVGEKRNAKGSSKRVTSLSNSSGKMESGEEEGGQRKKRKVDSPAGKGKGKGRGVGASDGAFKMSDSIDGGSIGIEKAGVKAASFGSKDDADLGKTDSYMTSSTKSCEAKNGAIPQRPPPLTGRSKTAAAFASPSYFGTPRRLYPRKNNNASLSNLLNSYGAAGGNRDSSATATTTPRRRQDGHRGAGSGNGKDSKMSAHSRQSRGSSKGRVEFGAEASGGAGETPVAAGNRRVTAAAVAAGRECGSEVVGEGAKGCNINRSKQRLSFSNKKGVNVGGTSIRGFYTDLRDSCGGDGAGDGDVSLYDDSARRDPDTGAGKHQVDNLGVAGGGGEMVLVGSRPGENGGGVSTVLDEIVTSFLRNQHERCPDPICVLPPLSLLEPHQCPGRTPAGAMGSSAPPNVAKLAALARQVCAFIGGG